MRKRNLSEFMCIEMLYDYKSKKLDPLRYQAVEEGLNSSIKVQEEFKKLNSGISYCDSLKNISVSAALADYILEEPTAAGKVFLKFKWQNLPQSVRWALEAVVVAVALALFVTQVPDLFKGEVIKSESMLVKKFDIQPPAEEIVPPPAIVIIPEIPVAQKVVPVVPKIGNAYVYRMTMYLDDVELITPEIVTLITSLGGKKAGDVELGWRRKGGSYFHFSVPEANSEQIQEGLKKYASFNIVKSPQTRVMPEGTERYILWLESKEKPEPIPVAAPTPTQETDPVSAAPGDEQKKSPEIKQENNETN